MKSKINNPNRSEDSPVSGHCISKLNDAYSRVPIRIVLTLPIVSVRNPPGIRDNDNASIASILILATSKSVAPRSLAYLVKKGWTRALLRANKNHDRAMILTFPVKISLISLQNFLSELIINDYHRDESMY